MIIEYNRPTKLEEALHLLARQQPKTVPLGGGTILNQPAPEEVAVVDLQGLGLNALEQRGQVLTIGAAASLQAFLEWPELLPAMVKATHHEASANLRRTATLAGTIVSADGRSPLVTVMLAMDAQLDVESQQNGIGTISLGDLLPMRASLLEGKLITRIHLPLNTFVAYEVVARTPIDRPIVCVAVAQWPSGRTRIALGGFGVAPVLAMDGPDSAGYVEAVQSAYAQAEDQWASASYRQDAAAILAGRCIHGFK
jgi:CO/xanthine dehydrogenase FAD-binding subunit